VRFWGALINYPLFCQRYSLLSSARTSHLLSDAYRARAGYARYLAAVLHTSQRRILANSTELIGSIAGHAARWSLCRGMLGSGSDVLTLRIHHCSCAYRFGFQIDMPNPGIFCSNRQLEAIHSERNVAS